MCISKASFRPFPLLFTWKLEEIENIIVSCGESKQPVGKLRRSGWKKHRDETSLWRGMIAREDDHSPHLFDLLTGSVSVSNLQRSTGDHSCTQYMYLEVL